VMLTAALRENACLAGCPSRIPQARLLSKLPPRTPTAASQRLVFDELAGTADFIESLAIGLKEAARRDDRVRVHSYLVDIVQCVATARGAYGRISALAGLEVRQ
jgi:hypothetical protein